MSEFFVECTECAEDVTGDKTIVLKWINDHECSSADEGNEDIYEDEDDEE